MNHTLTVRDVLWHSPDIFELQLESSGLAYVPGDCVALYGEDRSVSRPYSLASAPNESLLRFVIRRMPGGEVSPFLASRKPGDEVQMSPPFGWFRPGQAGNGAPSVFMATGTGIAPFLSYLRARPDAPPLACFYGVRAQGDALYVDWLQSVCPLRQAISREVVDGSHHGRVTDLFDQIPLGEDIHYYLCGLDAMIDEVTVWLEKQGTDITRIHRECFFNAL